MNLRKALSVTMLTGLLVNASLVSGCKKEGEEQPAQEAPAAETTPPPAEAAPAEEGAPADAGEGEEGGEDHGDHE